MNKINQTKQIITSLLDTDIYKLYMQQAVFHRYKNIHATAALYCRNNEKLGKYKDSIKHQINLMKNIKLQKSEYLYLKKKLFFETDYLDWLKKFRFNSKNKITIFDQKNNLILKIKGLWHEIILWEVPLLSLISEIIHKNKNPEIQTKDAIQHLNKNVKNFYKNAKNRKIDLSNFKLVEFGTRRRFSKKIQYTLIKQLKSYFPYFKGTSNLKMSQKLNLNPIGTQAHEWYQAHQQISKKLSESQKMALQIWLEEYPQKLNIALTDCITMNSFLHDFDITFSNLYHGMRHDSGDPIKWGEKAIKHYKKYGINPMTKTLIFSDNLNFKKALKIYKHFNKQTQLIFAIGTNLTCNIPDIKPLNIVIKLIECNGKPVAKLSDNPKKTTYNNKQFIYLLKKTFNL